MKMRKLLVTGALSLSLAFSSFVLPAYAVSFEDTVGIGSEMAIAKLVSLGLLPNPGENFNPDQAISRADFANLAKQLTGADASKGGKTVTYAELSKVLANGLGLKAAWTNRPIDYLFYLERKGVLDIDTDLDATVTRADAADAFDKYLTLKGTFTTISGVVAGASDTGLSITSESGTKAYPFAKDVSAFIGGQSTDLSSVQQGVPVEVVLNKNGQIAFVSGVFLDAEEGTLVLSEGKLKIADKFVKDININAYISPLPSQPSEPFTFAQFAEYQNKGISFSGQAFFTDQDEVTLIYPYISSIEGASVTFSAPGVVADFGEGFSLGFNLGAEVKVTIDGADSNIDNYKAYQKAGTKHSATLGLNANGEVVSIVVTSEKAE